LRVHRLVVVWRNFLGKASCLELGSICAEFTSTTACSMSTPEKQFSFSQITPLKEETLGRGSYGSVCKAKCDTLTCAAKIMHPLLFDFGDPGVDTIIKRFRQECEILSSINHPNVVQYLGTLTDPETGLPILLMELMDQSLTGYLRVQTEPLPLHTQVTFSLDIALALSHLHSNNIQHRDLSSNNILLLGDRRAKVTDFGMSRLERVNSRMTPATMCCPGTVDYMPPEALKENQPHYTDKLDVFSFGVLLIQIMTREFPKPSERFTTFKAQDPKNKRRLIEVLAPVKETERRENHISLVSKDNPLLNTALECINDKHEDRPSAGQVCGNLKVIRSTDAYEVSEVAGNYKNRYKMLKEDFDQREEALQKANIDLEDLREESSRAEGLFRRLLEDKDYVIREKDDIIKAQEEKLAAKKTPKLHWRRTGNAPVKFKGRGHTAVVGKKAYFHELGTKVVYEYNTKDERWGVIPDAPVQRGFTLISIHDLFLTTIGGYGNSDGKLHSYIAKDRKWVERFPPMGSTCVEAFAASTRDSVIVIGKRLQRGNTTNFQNLIVGYILDLQGLEWSSFQPTPFSPTLYLSAFMFVRDGILYHAGGCDLLGPTDLFYSCPVNKCAQSGGWKTLHSLPHAQQTPAVFGEWILAIGGTAANHTVGEEKEEEEGDRDSSPGNSTDETPAKPDEIKAVYRYDVETDAWEECGKVEEGRSNCMVAVVGDEMIVVGEDTSTEETSITSIARNMYSV
jgi:serine/threonine protein kinase